MQIRPRDNCYKGINVISMKMSQNYIKSQLF